MMENNQTIPLEILKTKFDKMETTEEQKKLANNCIHIVSKSADKERLLLLLEYGADINYIKLGVSPLFNFLKNEPNDETSISFLQCLLERGANPNIQDIQYKMTPLWYVLFFYIENPNFVNYVRLLIEYGADKTISKTINNREITLHTLIEENCQINDEIKSNLEYLLNSIIFK